MELNLCRICKSSHLEQVVDLGDQIVTSRFPDYKDYSTPSAKVCLVMCKSCKLVQLRYTTQSSEMYEKFYGYRSGINEMMKKHLQEYNEQLQSYVELCDGDYVLDIGSNDGTFLKSYPSSVNRVGCDPTGRQFKDYYQDMFLIPTYFTRDNILDEYPQTKFKLVSSISMFYDLPDPVQFAKDVHEILSDDGVWTLEQSYVGTMLERNSIDTICHEHLEYYGLKQIKEIMDRSGFKILDVSFNECNGGSFRVYVAKRECSKYKENVSLIADILHREREIHTVERYQKFMNDCKEQISILLKFIDGINNDNKKIYIYGASTKGNCLLQFANIGQERIPFAVERNPLKYGKMTSTGIPIISEEQMRNDNPEYLLVLPWHFKEGILQREKEYLDKGGQIIFPLPNFEIHSSKPRMLITGVDGQIGRYTVDMTKNDYQLYGLTKEIHAHDCVTRFKTDLSDLEKLVVAINPHSIIHLASITNTEDCENDPVKTVETNGLFAFKLCEIIHRNGLNCRLFNASSSEIYKGHLDYLVEENDTRHYPLSIYAVAKSFSHNIIDYYRRRYNHHFSNGVIFTTESMYRKNMFLLKKVANHAKAFPTTHSILELGSLNSYRSITHAEDVARAIKVIIEHKKGDDYLICQEESVKIEDLVVNIYRLQGIRLQKREDEFIDVETGLVVFKTGNLFRDNATNISGNCKKLISLGWRPRYSTEDILKSMLK